MGRKGRREERTELELEGKREEGVYIPLYSGSGIPGYCQVTVGRSLD